MNTPPLSVYLFRSDGSNDAVADVAALVLALNPLYWDFSHQAMAGGAVVRPG